MRRRRTLTGVACLLAAAGLLWGLAHWIYHAPIVHSETSTFSMADRDADEKYSEWCNELTHYITPRLCAYYELHPDRFKPTGKGEEIEIQGFTDFVRNDGFFQSPYRCRIRWGKLRDPWGDPIHFVQDLNMDGFIEARGQRRNVFDQAIYDDVGQHVDFLNEHRLGICKDNFKGIETHAWDSIFVLSYHHAKWWPNSQGRTNGNQPLGSETNRTSPAAASRRSL